MADGLYKEDTGIVTFPLCEEWNPHLPLCCSSRAGADNQFVRQRDRFRRRGFTMQDLQ